MRFDNYRTAVVGIGNLYSTFISDSVEWIVSVHSRLVQMLHQHN